MARDQLQKELFARLKEIQEDEKEPVWISGKQVTELFRKKSPSSIRMALLLMVDRGVLVRERKKGRGGRGKTGQSSWYSLADLTHEQMDDYLTELDRNIEEKKKYVPSKTG